MGFQGRLVRNIEDNFSKLEAGSGLSFEEIVEVLRKRQEDKRKKTIPVSIFDNDRLSALEAIVKYMREELGLNYRIIASLLGRNYGPIGVTYRNARRKMGSSLDVSSQERIPVSIFENKKLSVLECITSYLKDRLGLTYHEIALMLRRDDRTIWTVYKRAVGKSR